MMLLTRDAVGAQVIVDVDHDAIRDALTPDVVDAVVEGEEAGEVVEITLVVPARIVKSLASRRTVVVASP